MAKDQTKRIRPSLLQADVDAYSALLAIGDYAPANAAYTKEAAEDRLTSMRNAQQSEVNAQGALDTARDGATAAEWDFHNIVLNIKEQVIAQYGKDSDQVQSLGLKKKSEYKAPKPKKKANA